MYNAVAGQSEIKNLKKRKKKEIVWFSFGFFVIVFDFID